MEIWSFSSLKGNRINQSGWNLAWKRIPRVYTCVPNLALIGEGETIGAHTNSTFCQITVFARRSNSIYRLRWNLAWYNTSLVYCRTPNLAMIGKGGWMQELQHFCHGCFYPAGAIIYTDWCKIWHGSGWLFHAKFHLSLCKGMGMWVRPPLLKSIMWSFAYKVQSSYLFTAHAHGVTWPCLLR